MTDFSQKWTVYYNGLSYDDNKPDNSRIPRVERVYDLPDSLSIVYFRVNHESTASVEQCKKAETVLGVHICKNLFLCNRNKTQLYLIVMPEDKPFKTKELLGQE